MKARVAYIRSGRRIVELRVTGFDPARFANLIPHTNQKRETTRGDVNRPSGARRASLVEGVRRSTRGRIL